MPKAFIYDIIRCDRHNLHRFKSQCVWYMNTSLYRVRSTFNVPMFLLVLLVVFVVVACCSPVFFVWIQTVWMYFGCVQYFFTQTMLCDSAICITENVVKWRYCWCCFSFGDFAFFSSSFTILWVAHYFQFSVIFCGIRQRHTYTHSLSSTCLMILGNLICTCASFVVRAQKKTFLQFQRFL